MKTKVIAIALCAGLTALAQHVAPTDRVRADSPTVVTVRGTSDQVRTQPVAKECRRARAWNRLVRFAGWALNAEDDIPSARERQQTRHRSTIAADNPTTGR